MRVALYCRVSTEEQARNGLSIDTQLDNLRVWVQGNGHTIVGEYVDAGISGKKPYSKRPALAQFIKDLENGLTVDALVFTKLDRFFRSVKHYYQVVAIMDKHRVGWQAIQEDYETITSSGRFKVNIMLSVAEAEADRTSERIKVIMEAKRQKKEALSGHVPIGYKVENKKIVKDPEKALIVETLFNEYLKTGSIKAASDAVEAATGYHFYYRHASDTLANPSYYGCFHGLEDYAPAYIDRATHEHIAKMRRRVTRRPKHNQVYLFSGLLVCGECGSSFSPRTQHDRKNPPSVYNCRRRYENRTCDNKVNIDERDIERHLITTIMPQFDAYKDRVRNHTPTDNQAQIAALKRRRAKLSDLYLADLITLQDLKKQKAEIDAKLAKLEAPTPDATAAIERLLATDWQTAYESVSREAKRSFWRSLLSEIRVYSDRRIEYDFL